MPNASIVERLEGHTRAWMAWFALAAVPLAWSLGPVVDNDLGWHLQTGAWIAARHALPATDPFSQGGAHRPWIAYSWLFDLLVYGLDRILGLPGVVLYRAVVAALIGLAVGRLVLRRGGVALIWTAAALLVIRPSLTERPWLFSILFFALTLDAVLGLRAGRHRSAWWLVPVFALWANLHIQFVYGLAILGIAAVTAVADRRLGLAEPEGAASPGRLASLTAACMLATLANPAGPRLYGVILDLAHQTSAFAVVAELHAPSFRSAEDWITASLLLTAAFALGRRTQIPLFEIGALAMAAFLGLRAERDTWVIALTAGALLSPVRILPRRSWQIGRRTRAALATFEIAAMTLGGALVGAAAARQYTPFLEAALARAQPVAAVQEIERRRLAGPLYNDFNWGGFLIWALPRLPVAMDGRTNLYSAGELAAHLQTWSGLASPGQEDPALRRARVVLAAKSSPFTARLRIDPRWQLVYEDALAAVFVPATLQR